MHLRILHAKEDYHNQYGELVVLAFQLAAPTDALTEWAGSTSATWLHTSGSIPYSIISIDRSIRACRSSVPGMGNQESRAESPAYNRVDSPVEADDNPSALILAELVVEQRRTNELLERQCEFLGRHLARAEEQVAELVGERRCGDALLLERATSAEAAESAASARLSEQVAELVTEQRHTNELLTRSATTAEGTVHVAEEVSRATTAEAVQRGRVLVLLEDIVAEQRRVGGAVADLAREQCGTNRVIAHTVSSEEEQLAHLAHLAELMAELIKEQQLTNSLISDGSNSSAAQWANLGEQVSTLVLEQRNASAILSNAANSAAKSVHGVEHRTGEAVHIADVLAEQRRTSNLLEQASQPQEPQNAVQSPGTDDSDRSDAASGPRLTASSLMTLTFQSKVRWFADKDRLLDEIEALLPDAATEGTEINIRFGHQVKIRRRSTGQLAYWVDGKVAIVTGRQIRTFAAFEHFPCEDIHYPERLVTNPCVHFPAKVALESPIGECLCRLPCLGCQLCSSNGILTDTRGLLAGNAIMDAEGKELHATSTDEALQQWMSATQPCLLMDLEELELEYLKQLDLPGVYTTG
ncbi:hypothetical protein CYMTET_30554 [Cymbomonas tetramitiformis]|uniref:Uncharacterized protein n=1 Tax=Cymbomonas tetramitiformis TaxID=36881 RepID=A0AAE0FJ16_9CHLO|nr:hypothetical protein CYMTET_30554 [Cymbomonas tetramitiformis]